MFLLPSSVRISVESEPTDLRHPFDGLLALTRSVIGVVPMSGHLFVFLNRRRDRIKALVWDRTEHLLLYKRLERGTFRIPVEPATGHRHVAIDAGELTRMLEGLDWRNTGRQSWWARAASCARTNRPVAEGHGR